MKIEGLNSPDFLYVRLENKAVIDILSLTDWEYPDLNEIFLKLGTISKFIYGMLFVSIALFKMHISNEINYIFLVTNKAQLRYDDEGGKKPKFYDTFIMYGKFEKSVTESRFSLYLISLVIFLLLMLKRIYLGGFSKYIFSLISFILSFVFVLQNLIFIVLTLILILLSIFSLAAFYDIFKEQRNDIIQTKLFLQLFFNIIIIGLLFRIFIDSIKLTKALNALRQEVYNFYNNIVNAEQGEIRECFQYKTLEENAEEYFLSEVQIEGHPKYLYYNLYDNKSKIPVDTPILIINNNLFDNNKKNDNNQNNNTIIVNNENNNNNINIIPFKNDDKSVDKLIVNNKKNDRRNSKLNSRRNSKLNNRRNSHMEKKTEDLNEEKIKSENISLKIENQNLKNELAKLKEQLSSLVNKVKV